MGDFMRVIAGSARRIVLKTVPGMDTRPTTDRIKETLFNMLQFELADARFLDLFSGSGAIGIEALSRGAAEAVFVEKDRKAVACIENNLKATHLEERAQIFPCDAQTAIMKMSGQEKFDFVFMDPPYQASLEAPTLEAVRQAGLVDKDSVIIIEAKKDTAFEFVETLGFLVTKVKEYKTNKHVFLCLAGEEKG